MDPPTNDTVRRCVESLEKIYKYYHEPNYATLALIALCFGANDKYYNEFINKYPKHVAIPYVFLGMQFKKYLNGEYDAHIKEIKNLMEKYKNIKSPEGWDYALDCSHDLIWTYCKLNDIENAQKYLKLIEEKAPDYYFLENLKSMINVTK